MGGNGASSGSTRGLRAVARGAASAARPGPTARGGAAATVGEVGRDNLPESALGLPEQPNANDDTNISAHKGKLAPMSLL